MCWEKSSYLGEDHNFSSIQCNKLQRNNFKSYHISHQTYLSLREINYKVVTEDIIQLLSGLSANGRCNNLFTTLGVLVYCRWICRLQLSVTRNKLWLRTSDTKGNILKGMCCAKHIKYWRFDEWTSWTQYLNLQFVPYCIPITRISPLTWFTEIIRCVILNYTLCSQTDHQISFGRSSQEDWDGQRM